MKELLSKKEYRHLLLIETLFSANGWISLSELATQSDYSLRILKDDIAELKATYEQFSIQTSHEGIRLTFHPNHGIQSIYQKILLESELFALLQLLLLNDSLSTEDLAEKLFISPSTLRRMIKRVNNYLAYTYSLKIQSNPYRLEGDEKTIRYLYYQLYFEGFSTLVWPFDSINEEKLQDFLSTFLEEVGVSLTFSDFHLVKIVTAINSIRLSNGHEIRDVPYTFHETVPAEKEYISWKNAESLFPFSLSFEKIEQLFFPFSTYIFLKSFDHLTMRMESDSKMRAAHHYLSYWLKKLSIEWGINIPNLHQLLVDIHNISAFLDKEIQTHTFLYDQKTHFTQKIQQNYPKLYKQLYHGLLLYRKKLGSFCNDTLINCLVHTVFTHWYNLLPELQKSTRKDVRVLVLSTSNIHHANMMRDVISYQFNGQPDINLLFETKENTPELHSLAYDMVICNSYLPNLIHSSYICVENLPTHKDIRTISDMLQQLHLPKNDTA
jgi:AraC-like DNA-binding protein